MTWTETMPEIEHSYVVCVENKGCPESLEVRKIYLRLPDRRAEEDGFLRVIDGRGLPLSISLLRRDRGSVCRGARLRCGDG